MSIHSEHPFLPPEPERNPLRRFRGRLGAPVTLWTTGAGSDRAGLTVSSLLIADGDPGFVVGVLDPLSDLWDGLQASGTATVQLLDWEQRQLADRFGFVAPAPGGVFAGVEWIDTDWGPVLAAGPSWLGGRVVPTATSELGWGLAVRLQIEHVEIGADSAGDDGPLLSYRGRYRRLDPS